MHESPATCLNCAAPLSPDYTYCPACSQRTRLHRLSLHEIAHEAWHYFTHADRSILSLVRNLATRTGAVARRYVDGRRKATFPPLNFFLIVGTLFVLVASTIAPKPSFDVLKAHPEVAAITDSVKQAKYIMVYERQHRVITFMSKYSNVVSMVAVPLTTLLFWLFYRKGRYNYAEHLVAGLFMVGFTNLVYALLMVPVAALLGVRLGGSGSLPLVSLHLCLQVAYGAVFYYYFINRRGAGAACKAAFVSLAATAFWFFLSGTAIGIYIATGFKALR
ncbi:DUF3667 domain-containing protein [Flaviaesturariibacter amylovorans]|uniref:DUF3667 domain-containing protein n=1 Tax=Flaviaesturariibacter amylovorans TaxID=1084520 RepID=A0ABP8HUC3_9BACT